MWARRIPCRDHCDRMHSGVSAPRKNLATYFDEYSRRRGLLDVLADHHRAHSGTYSRRPIRAVEYFSVAGVQGGWLIAGSLVGFMYNHNRPRWRAPDRRVHLRGLVPLLLFAVRKGRHVVLRPEELLADILAAETQLQRFGREMREGLALLRDHRPVILLGNQLALFLGAMDYRQ